MLHSRPGGGMRTLGSFARPWVVVGLRGFLGYAFLGDLLLNVQVRWVIRRMLQSSACSLRA